MLYRFRHNSRHKTAAACHIVCLWSGRCFIGLHVVDIPGVLRNGNVHYIYTYFCRLICGFFVTYKQNCTIQQQWRAVLIELFFLDFIFFFPKNKKSRRNRNRSKVWKFNRGQNIWNASHSNIWKKKKENIRACHRPFLGRAGPDRSENRDGPGRAGANFLKMWWARPDRAGPRTVFVEPKPGCPDPHAVWWMYL